MAQIFSKRAVLLIKLGVIAVPVFVVCAITVYEWRASMPASVGEVVVQPIPFSHKHHVGDDGIDCRYCHTSVERSRTAGMPSTDICLSCHSQLYKDSPLLAKLHESRRNNTPIRWQRVTDLPDFVYFDHSIHINKGVACATCHGPVAQMPLTWRHASLDMQWCLACHRDPAPRLHPHHQLFTGEPLENLDRDNAQALKQAMHILDTRRLTDCSTCHR